MLDIKYFTLQTRGGRTTFQKEPLNGPSTLDPSLLFWYAFFLFSCALSKMQSNVYLKQNVIVLLEFCQFVWLWSNYNTVRIRV